MSTPALGNLSNLSPFTKVVHSDGTTLSVYSDHYGIRIKRQDSAGSWTRYADGADWKEGGPDCSGFWTGMTGPPNGEISGDLYRTLVYAVGAAEGMTRVVNRFTPSKDRRHCRESLATVVIGEECRIVVSSGKEYDRKDRLSKDPQPFDMSIPAEATTSADQEVGVNAQYLIEIMDVIGRDLDLWVRGPQDPVCFRGLYGEAVLMPVRL